MVFIDLPNRIQAFDEINVDEKNSCRAEREPIVRVKAGTNEANVGGRCVFRHLDSAIDVIRKLWVIIKKSY